MDFEQQLLISSINLLKNGFVGTESKGNGIYNSIMEPDTESKILHKFEDYKKKYPKLNRYPKET